jgi:hypothetical protein
VGSGLPDHRIGIWLLSAFGYTEKLPVYEAAPWTVRYLASLTELTDKKYAAALADIYGRPRVVIDSLPSGWDPSSIFQVDIAKVLGDTLSKTNPVNVRLSDGTNDIPLPTALDTGAFKVREQNPITGFATAANQIIIQAYIDGIETLLAGGLPAALDTGAVKTREQNPITGFATAANQIIIQAYIDGIETLLGGGLPAALDNLALKIREQNWPIPTTYTGYNVTMTDADHEYSQAIAGTVRAYEIATRDRTAFRFSFATGKVATPTAPYKTIAAKEGYWKEGVKMTDPTFYFASASAGKVIELDVWT